MPSITRRFVLKCISLFSASASLPLEAKAKGQLNETNTAETSPSVNWENTYDRVWLGGECWANPMEDWHIVDGGAECQSGGGNRNIHLLTHQLTNADQPFAMSVTVSQIAKGKNDSGVGFRVGIQSDINEYRSNCFAKTGIKAGIVDGELTLGNKRVAISFEEALKDVALSLTGKADKNNETQYVLNLVARDKDSKVLGTLKTNVAKENILGNVSVVNNFDPKTKPNQGARYRFTNWSAVGKAFTVDAKRKFGPILWTMYSLSDSRSEEGFVMKLSALTGPLGEDDSKDVELFIKQDNQWNSLGTASLDTDAWVATFRIANWNETIATPFMVVYRQKNKSGSETESIWEGTIKPNPVDRPLRIGALTCQNDYAFPYEPVANNLKALDPDLLYFSGDQLYESHGGYGLIRDPAEPAILNYLRKFYQFGWSFRDAMRDRPTLCLPDDHDVFQGNIWGEGGAKMSEGSTSSKGGYREPARMVNVVHKTNAAHHPDYYEPQPVKQGISVYYGDMVYGGVGFAILSDRQFKSGPERVETGSGRADHVRDPDFDTTALDKPGLELLGKRQEDFLRKWSQDWRGHSMKVVLSQTVFAGVATHHGGYDGYLKADLDSGGWPQSKRNLAIEILRQAKPLHINGDQHLTSLVQYGVEKQRDGFWSFCTPAIAVGYPRWWRPDEVGMNHQNRPEHGLSNTGEYTDGLGNRIYVYAVGDPQVATKKHRYEKAHQKGSGFGFVTIDTKKGTYQLDSYRFLVDARNLKPEDQFPGWPVTIHQEENLGQNRLK